MAFMTAFGLRRLRWAAPLLLAPLGTWNPPVLAQPAAAQKSRIEGRGGLSVPIEIREQYLGKSKDKTVVKFVLTVSKGDLKAAGALEARVYSFELVGEAKDPEGKVLTAFRVPVAVDLANAEASRPASATFLQSLPPGPMEIQFRLDGLLGRTFGMRSISIIVPAMQSEFRAEDAGTDTAGLPSASAVILENENRTVVPEGTTGLVQILEPRQEVPVGLLRLECEVKPPVVRVEFWLEDKKILVKNRAPYTVEIDLGKVPKKQTLKALGFDALGNFVDADAWSVNERDARLSVRILELPKQIAGDTVDLKVAVQSIAGGVARSLKLYLDTDLVKEWAGPPYTATVDAAKLKKATLLRATATDEEGKEFSDLKLLKGDSRFLSKVEVNLVELNVSVFDAQGKLAKGLAQSDFTVLEDSEPQDVSSFEFAESLPLSLGIVIDGSGSMRDSMPLVHQAATEFVEKLVGPKDQGFVMEFREAPTLLASLTKNQSDLVRAIGETRAKGATALYDAAIMALYQFRAVPGKKAIVILTDGDDNHSWTDYETLRRYARSAGVPIYFIGLNLSMLDMKIKSHMTELAADTGAEAFFVSSAKSLPEVYRKIETELRSQYFVRYLTNSKKGENEFRKVEVRLKDPKLRAKTIRGYFP
jgi:Ca-activated chloride channel family protein